MKTQVTKPIRTKARYTQDYKQEALELWRASGPQRGQGGAELGIRPPLLYPWARLEREPDASKTKSKPGHSAEGTGSRDLPLTRRECQTFRAA
jgi:transposase-like protein